LIDRPHGEEDHAMRTAIHLMSFIVVLAPCIARADIVRHTEIPEPYRGTWATEAAACAPGKGAIVLSAKTYVAPGANCTVVFVDETADPKGAIFSARLSCAAGAEKAAKKSFRNLIIRPDKNGLSVGPTFSGLSAYQRCQSTEEETKR
jgi:hypothetical protein